MTWSFHRSGRSAVNLDLAAMTPMPDEDEAAAACAAEEIDEDEATDADGAEETDDEEPGKGFVQATGKAQRLEYKLLLIPR